MIRRLLLTLGAIACIASPVSAQTADVREFLARVTRDVASRDPQVLRRLVQYEAANEFMRASLDDDIQSIIRSAATTVELIPLDAMFRPEYVINGVRRRLDVVPLGMVRFNISGVQRPMVANSFAIPYGYANGRTIRFGRLISEPTGYSGPPDVGFALHVTGPFARIAGECRIARSGERMSEPIAAGGGPSVSYSFFAQSIESCSIVADPSANRLRLEITRQGVTIFDSGPTTGNTLTFVAPRRP